MWSKEICGVFFSSAWFLDPQRFQSISCNLWMILTLWVMNKNGVQSDRIKWGRQIYSLYLDAVCNGLRPFSTLQTRAQLWNRKQNHSFPKYLPVPWSSRGWNPSLSVSLLVPYSVEPSLYNANVTNKTAWELGCFLSEVLRLPNHWTFSKTVSTFSKYFYFPPRSWKLSTLKK